MNKIRIPLSYRAMYERAYAILENITPIAADCGKLCDKACCRVEEEITGMYLFPEENVMFRDMPSYAKLYDTDFEYDYGKYADLFTCDGSCERYRRPLACRIFPLLPYCHEGEELQIIMDPRGRGMCPLAQTLTVEELDPEFVDAVSRSMRLIMKNAQVRQFVYSLSEQIDGMRL